jgi:hypothetical protein
VESTRDQALKIAIAPIKSGDKSAAFINQSGLIAARPIEAERPPIIRRRALGRPHDELSFRQKPA